MSSMLNLLRDYSYRGDLKNIFGLLDIMVFDGYLDTSLEVSYVNKVLSDIWPETVGVDWLGFRRSKGGFSDSFFRTLVAVHGAENGNNYLVHTAREVEGFVTGVGIWCKDIDLRLRYRVRDNASRGGNKDNLFVLKSKDEGCLLYASFDAGEDSWVVDSGSSVSKVFRSIREHVPGFDTWADKYRDYKYPSALY